MRLRVRELAERQGLSLAAFQRETKLPMTTSRRLWYGTQNGLKAGEPLQAVRFDLLKHLSEFFGVRPGDLFIND